MLDIKIPLPTVDIGPFSFADEKEKVKNLPKVTFASFVDMASNGKYQWYPYCVRLAQVLQKVADGEIKRLMVFMPPRHGKSELVSRLFSAYYLYRYPEKFVGINSYAAELAYTFSRNARDNFTFAGGSLSENAAAVKHWETSAGGGLWAAGVGGPITGKGFDLGIIDDPIKNSEDAASEVIRRKQKDWFDSTFSTREEPNAAIIVIQTRWHEDDLSGYLLSKESEEPDRWHIIHYEAVKNEDGPDYPETCTLEPDPREEGEALAPMRYSLPALKKILGRIGSYFFGSLYQQNPKPHEGNRFKRHWFTLADRVPSACDRVRYWDKAGTEGGGAFTCGVLLARCRETGIYYVEDLVRGQWSAGQREKVIKQTSETDANRHGVHNVQIFIEQEPGSGGKESAENTIRNLAGFPIHADRPTGNKELRANPFAAQAEVGNIKILISGWTTDYIDRLMAFPFGAYKDDVDATSGAFNKLALGAGSLQRGINPLAGYRG